MTHVVSCMVGTDWGSDVLQPPTSYLGTPTGTVSICLRSPCLPHHLRSVKGLGALDSPIPGTGRLWPH